MWKCELQTKMQMQILQSAAKRNIIFKSAIDMTSRI